MNRTTFDDPTYAITLPESAMILQPHWQYKLKPSDV